MADNNTIITEAKTLISNLITQVKNHDFTSAANNFHDSLTIIKPDGTLDNKKSWIKMISDSKMIIVNNQLLFWNFIELSDNNNMCFCGYTTEFTFNIVSENQEIKQKAIFTALLKKFNGQWKIFYLQRTDTIRENV